MLIYARAAACSRLHYSSMREVTWLSCRHVPTLTMSLRFRFLQNIDHTHPTLHVRRTEVDTAHTTAQQHLVLEVLTNHVKCFASKLQLNNCGGPQQAAASQNSSRESCPVEGKEVEVEVEEEGIPGDEEVEEVVAEEVGVETATDGEHLEQKSSNRTRNLRTTTTSSTYCQMRRRGRNSGTH